MPGDIDSEEETAKLLARLLGEEVTVRFIPENDGISVEMFVVTGGPLRSIRFRPGGSVVLNGDTLVNAAMLVGDEDTDARPIAETIKVEATLSSFDMRAGGPGPFQIGLHFWEGR